MLSAVHELLDCRGTKEALLSRQCVDWGDVAASVSVVLAVLGTVS